MKHPYEDILYLPHHVSSRRARMPLQDRAAQFSPFAALTGYDAAIDETARLTQQPVFLDVDAQAELDQVLNQIQERIAVQPEVCLTSFVQDLRKSGGQYVTVTARVMKISSIGKWLLLDNGCQVFFEDILALRVLG